MALVVMGGDGGGDGGSMLVGSCGMCWVVWGVGLGPDLHLFSTE